MKELTLINKAKCRHERNSWLIANGYYEWCFVCGALRTMRMTPDACVPTSKWCKPTGDRKNNPWEEWASFDAHTTKEKTEYNKFLNDLEKRKKELRNKK